MLDIDGTKPREGWVVWQEAGRYPDLIVELMSPTTAQVDLITKKDLYEKTFHTRNYFVYNPFDPDSLRGWCLDRNQSYQELQRNDRGWLWCSTLGFWLGTWSGTIDYCTCSWLRFYDSDFNLLLLPEEAERERADAQQQRADAEQERAERLAARLKELGIDPDTVE